MGTFQHRPLVVKSFWFQLKCLVPSKSITVHSIELVIDEPNVQLQPIGCGDEACKGPIAITKHSYDVDNEFYRIDFDETLMAGREYNLTIPFSGNLTEGLAGYYRSKYLDRETGKSRWLAVTQFEPTDARRAFPCFDEPEFKAVFSIAMGHSPNHTSLSNMPLKQSETL